eukprot:TRINITY_DN38513_c0_g1_i1.p1 TRINITY_DN38513_c0_g1~~TRINITY_DN38513_c0_g1_i1.p1  ORF type:complete len:161 (-),score=34.53 TRINITY_DN38513_c0_g1_i1:288-770(-)
MITEDKTVQILKQIRILSNVNDYYELSQLYDQLERKSNFLCLLILKQQLKKDAITFLQNQKKLEIQTILFYESKEEMIYLLNSYVEFVTDTDEKFIFHIEAQEDAKMLIKKMLVKFRKIQTEKMNSEFNCRNSCSPVTLSSPKNSQFRPEREEIPKYYYI